MLPPRPPVTCHLAVRGPQPSSWPAALTGAHLLRKSVAWINRACSASHSHPSLAGRKALGLGLLALSITFHSNPATAGCCSSDKLPWERGSDKRKEELVLVGLGPLPVTSESLLGPRPLPPPSASLPPPTPLTLTPSQNHLSLSPPSRHHGLMTQHPA